MTQPRTKERRNFTETVNSCYPGIILILQALKQRSTMQ
nr:MAG TPA: hypothetical protein [Caudoviricetes sp.]